MEANHSSYVARIGKQSSVEPAEAMKNMIDRQTDKTKERSERLIRYSLEILSLAHTLQDDNDKIALEWLCKEGFLL